MPALYLSNPTMLNALGHTPAMIWQNLLERNQQGMVRRSDLLIGGDVTVGAVTASLPSIDNVHSRFNSRNNRLLFAAYQKIAEPVQNLISRYGKNRIAVVLGSSTSGISETEAAFRHIREHGTPPKDFDYSQHEMGSPALFMAALLGLT